MSQRFTALTARGPSGVSFPGSADHAIAAWVRVATAGGGCQVINFGSGNNFANIRSSTLNFHLEEGTSTPSTASNDDTSAVVLNTWRHFALVYVASTHALTSYVDGVQLASHTLDLSSRATLGVQTFFLTSDGTSDFTAQDLMAFTQALTPAQIQECMRLAAPVGVTPYFWFKLLNSAPTTDSSGNGHTLSSAGEADGTQILISATGTTSSSGSAAVFSNAVPATSSQRWNNGTTNSTASAVNFAGNAAHTVCGWAYVTTAGGSDVCYLDPGGGADAANAIWLGFDGTNWQWNDAIGGGGYAYTQAVTTGSWHHLALTYDGTNCRAYFDGALVNGPTAASLGGRANMNHLDIGYGGDFTVQSVMVFSQALSAAEIAQTMRLQPPAGVVPYAWYPFTAGSVTTDQSGNGHTLSAGGDANGSQILLVASGGTSTTGSGAVSKSNGIAGTGTTNTTGAAAITSAAALVVAGTTRTTGAVALSVAATLVGTGSTQTTGAAASSSVASLTAAGTTNATGSATVTQAGQTIIVAAGSVQTSGSAVVSSAVGIVASGQTQSTGSASFGLSLSIAAAGLTQSAGSASVSNGSAPSTGGAGRQTGSRQRLAMPFTGRRQVRC